VLVWLSICSRELVAAVRGGAAAPAGRPADSVNVPPLIRHISDPCHPGRHLEIQNVLIPGRDPPASSSRKLTCSRFPGHRG
jgi:hypothetical protein